MVKRVFGRIDGVEVNLTHDNGDQWSVLVPFDKDCQYVVEILAEDDAGNQSYIAKLLYIVDIQTLTAKLLEFPYYGELIEPYYFGELAPLGYFAEPLITGRR